MTKDCQNMEPKEETDKLNDEEIDDLEWSPDQEILLLYSLHGYKPVGTVKYFNMFVIQERLCSAMNKQISSKAIWKKLNNMYDLEALDEAEAELSAIEKVDMDFALPENEFGELMAAKLAGKELRIKVENENEEGQNDSEGVDPLIEIKLESEIDEVDKDSADPAKGAGIEKSSKKENIKRQGKKSNSWLLKDNITVKKENVRETNRKDILIKKETAKEMKKAGTKEDDKKEFGKKNTQDVKKDIGKEDKKEVPAKGNKRESTVKNVAEQTKKDIDLKKNEQKKTPTQRGGMNQSRCETPKQTLETTKRSEAAKTLRSETPKSLRADATAKPQRVDSLRKDSTSDKKKEAPDKGERKSPEKTPDSVRGSKRTREKKMTETETPATKRERSRDSTSKDTPTEEPPMKKAKVALKGRPTRNSLEPQQKPASPVLSAQKRRTRP